MNKNRIRVLKGNATSIGRAGAFYVQKYVRRWYWPWSFRWKTLKQFEYVVYGTPDFLSQKMGAINCFYTLVSGLGFNEFVVAEYIPFPEMKGQLSLDEETWEYLTNGKKEKESEAFKRETQLGS